MAEYILILIAVVAVTLIGIFIYIVFRDHNKEKTLREERRLYQQEERRLKLLAFLEYSKNELIQAVQSFPITQNPSLYHPFSTFETWKQKYEELYEVMKEIPLRKIQLGEQELVIAEKFLDDYKNLETKRKLANEKFVQSEIIQQDKLFSQIEGISLDNQQREAIIIDEDNSLVIAGAGSGKTLVIVGKLIYLSAKFNIDPREVLLISFTRKSALSLQHRISHYNYRASTFHKLGLEIITKATNIKPSIYDSNQFGRTIQNIFFELISQDTYLERATNFFTEQLRPYKSQFEFKEQGQYIQFLKDQNFQTYRETPLDNRGKVTYKREVVKSAEECMIANFLYFNNIDYKYEDPYEYETADKDYAQYKPDFKITQDDKIIYLEHFGIARNGDVPDWFESGSEQSAKEKYQAGIDWKRSLHTNHKTVLIESYSYEMKEGTLFNNLSSKLKEQGIVLNPKSDKEKWDIINSVANDEVEAFITLACTFITLLKSNFTSEEIDREEFLNKKEERNVQFWQLVKPIYQAYQNLLTERGEIDFNDMINKASQFIKNKTVTKPLKYIIIDEFQDISFGRYKLIKALKEQNPGCKTFCVGDDWQSIYRFSGSDITLFKDFQQYFGFTHSSRIETTYRFNEPLIGLSSEFILKNPYQTTKKLRAFNKISSTKYSIRYSGADENDDTDALLEVMEELNNQGALAQKEILIISRYTHDLKRLQNRSGKFAVNSSDNHVIYQAKLTNNDGVSKLDEVRIPFITVHKAKGLEADIVIILNCNAGKYGFPSEMSDDPVIEMLLAHADNFPNSEERRLFYVAMTRAKAHTYFITNKIYQSKFISEIENDINNEADEKSAKKCPKCFYGNIVKRRSGNTKHGNKYSFYGCTNYLYGCEYSYTHYDKS